VLGWDPIYTVALFLSNFFNSSFSSCNNNCQFTLYLISLSWSYRYSFVYYSNSPQTTPSCLAPHETEISQSTHLSSLSLLISKWPLSLAWTRIDISPWMSLWCGCFSCSRLRSTWKRLSGQFFGDVGISCCILHVFGSAVKFLLFFSRACSCPQVTD